MANHFDLAFASLRSAFQSACGATPTITIGATEAQIIPSEQGINDVFVDGGTANGARVMVMCRESDFSTIPTKFDSAVLADHPSAADGTYQVLEVTQREGTLMLTLGNIDSET